MEKDNNALNNFQRFKRGVSLEDKNKVLGTYGVFWLEYSSFGLDSGVGNKKLYYCT